MLELFRIISGSFLETYEDCPINRRGGEGRVGGRIVVAGADLLLIHFPPAAAECGIDQMSFTSISCSISQLITFIANQLPL